jgi:ribose transport system substrate-binding protein
VLRDRENTSRRGKLVVGAVVGAALLAACGGNSKPSSAGSPSAGAGGSAAETAAAQAKVEAFKKEPTAIRVTDPLTSAPEKGKTFVWLKCDVGQCKDEGDGIKEATEAIGWNYKEYNYKSADPATLVSAMKQALKTKPAGVALSGLPRAVWESVVPAYQAAKVPIVIGYIGGGDNVKDPVIGEIGGDLDVTEYGDMIAQWFIADSQAKGKAVLSSVNDFPVLKTFSTSFKASVAAGCSACTIKEVNATIPQVFAGAIPGQMVSALQADKSIKYVISSDMPFLTGISSKLSAANLTGVKVAAESGDVAALTLMKNGDPAYQATTGLALHYTGWAFVDVVLRHEQGLPIAPYDGGLPKQLLVPGVSFEVSDSYDKPTTFRDDFKKLWKVG